MRPAAIRLALALALFLGWIGYLAFQAATLPQTDQGWPLVLSRPQILASELDVIADVPEATGEVEVTVIEVLYPEDARVKPGDKLKVTNIGECAPLPRSTDGPPPPKDWSGPGRYLLPLRALPGQKYEVAPIPPSPGFFTGGAVEPPARLYPDKPQTLAQYRAIRDAKWKLEGNGPS
jgi:hypothetical protein